MKPTEHPEQPKRIVRTAEIQADTIDERVMDVSARYPSTLHGARSKERKAQ